MEVETIAILRSILFQLMTAKTLDEAIEAVKVMCSGDDIAAVEQQVAERRARENRGN